MEVIHKKFKPHSLSGDWALLIGNFDGVHLGHQALIRRLLDEQTRSGGRAGVLTFDPHPKKLLQPHIPFPHIYEEDAKWRLLAETGLDACFVVPFTPAFAALKPEEFLSKLFGFVSLKRLIVGWDFNFGKDRQGGAQLLGEEAARRGVEFVQLPPVREAGLTVSSTMIRRLLFEADFDMANRLLGRPWEISGLVTQGRQLGRELGFPTLNLFPQVLLPLRHGVYLSEVRLGGETYQGVTNIGHAPTLGGPPLLKVESHLFDFHANAYGQEAIVQPQCFLREEQKFAGLEALKAQISRDVAQAKGIFAQWQAEKRY